MIEIKNLKHPHLSIADWQVTPGDAWCVMGRNGAGKQYVDKLLLGELTPDQADCFQLVAQGDRVRLISLEAQQRIYERELQQDDGDYTDQIEPGTRAAAFLPDGRLNDPLIDMFNLRHRLQTGYCQLSTGESRKLLVLQAIFEGVELLILDNPFDSLDVGACEALSTALSAAAKAGVTMVFLLSNRQDIPAWCTACALVEQGELSVLGELADPATQRAIDSLLDPAQLAQPELPESALPLAHYAHPYLIALNNCTVTYSGKAVLEGVDLMIEPLQHTLITGENGSGKSTLLGLVTGDCPQCFSNDVTVFGLRRGSGESVWDIKAHMGIISADLHRRYRVSCTALTAVCSGFFDSIGVYQPITPQQTALAKQWLALAGLAAQADTAFGQLSYGEQRLVLIARALVKSPLLLILDEATQGLDELNRYRVLRLLEQIADRQHSTMVFVSHRRDEHLPLFVQRLHLANASISVGPRKIS